MSLIRGNALALPLADESVDLIVTSPPYFGLRDYRTDHPGEIGSEPTPQDFLEALWAVTAECWRVLKPTGSMFVNLGDKRSGSGGHNNAGISKHGEKRGPRSYNKAAFGRRKSKMFLPHRYAIGCEDGLADPDGIGWVARGDIVWAKPNGLPESVTDRVRDSHEFWFHLTRDEHYFSAVDEIREPHTATTTGRDTDDWRRGPSGTNRSTEVGRTHDDGGPLRDFALSPLGKLPGSVWTIPTEPLRVPDGLPQHFAAFPSEWPRRIILGWSPSGVCEACGQGRRPVTERSVDENKPPARRNTNVPNVTKAGQGTNGSGSDLWGQWTKTEITGYTCACPDTDAPTRPAVVLDPFAGTGTTVAVANALGRHGIGVDLSADYLRLARWRCQDPALRAKVLGVDKPKPQIEGQLDLLGGAA